MNSGDVFKVKSYTQEVLGNWWLFSPYRLNAVGRVGDSVIEMIAIICMIDLWSKICFNSDFRDKALSQGDAVTCPKSSGEPGSLSLRAHVFIPFHPASAPPFMSISTFWPLSLHQSPYRVRITDQIRAWSHRGAEDRPQTPLSAPQESGMVWGIRDQWLFCAPSIH